MKNPQNQYPTPSSPWIYKAFFCIFQELFRRLNEWMNEIEK